MGHYSELYERDSERYFQERKNLINNAKAAAKEYERALISLGKREGSSAWDRLQESIFWLDH